MYDLMSLGAVYATSVSTPQFHPRCVSCVCVITTLDRRGAPVVRFSVRGLLLVAVVTMLQALELLAPQGRPWHQDPHPCTLLPGLMASLSCEIPDTAG